MSHPPLLIESWLPIEAIGAETKRERGVSSALPPLYFLRLGFNLPDEQRAMLARLWSTP